MLISLFIIVTDFIKRFSISDKRGKKTDKEQKMRNEPLESVTILIGVMDKSKKKDKPVDLPKGLNYSSHNVKNEGYSQFGH